MSKISLIVHELEGKGFWVEVHDGSWWLPRCPHFLQSDGSLTDSAILCPARVVSYGLFKTKDSAVLAANQFANIACRLEGRWSINVRT